MLDSERLQRELIQGSGRSLRLHYFESCESTNLECMRLYQDGSIVIAEQQTRGRGRRGRDWLSPALENIYCSLGIVKTMKPELLGMLSIQAGVAIVEVLHAWQFTQVRLKWPNDILMMGRKLGGILIETRVLQPQQFYLVIGFGLNIQLQKEISDKIDQPAISLNEMTAEPVDRFGLLKDLIFNLVQSIHALDEDRISQLTAQFNRLDPLQGKEVMVKTRQDEWSGVYRGIQPDGQIQVEIGSELQVFSAADISLRGV